MSVDTTPPDQPSIGRQFWHALGTFFRFFLRLAFVVILAVFLGSAIYFGITIGLPALQRQYIQPVQDNSLRLEDLENQYGQDIQNITSRLDSLSDRLETLEAQSDDNKETHAILDAQMDSLLEAQATQAATLEELSPLQNEVAEHREAIDELSAEQGALQTETEAVSDAITEFEQDLQELIEERSEQADQLANLQRDIQLLWTLDLITRSRLDIAQDNFGLARSAVQAAHDRLAVLEEETQIEESEVVVQIKAYLDTALENLPDDPQEAEVALLNAWQLLVLNLPVEQP